MQEDNVYEHVNSMGTIFRPITVVPGTIGTYVVGYLFDKMHRRYLDRVAFVIKNEDLQYWKEIE